MKIIIGSDHKGFERKEFIKNNLSNVVWEDVGTYNGSERVDYPLYARALVEKIKQKEAALGILICGSGIGMSIAANRFKNIYAALCWNPGVAKAAREDDHANILVLSSDFTSHDESLKIIKAWLQAVPKEGVYQKRLHLIDTD